MGVNSITNDRLRDVAWDTQRYQRSTVTPVIPVATLKSLKSLTSQIFYLDESALSS